MDSRWFDRGGGLEKTLGSLIGGTGANAALLLIERVKEGVVLHKRDAKLRSGKVVMEKA